jgi:hypothetical protein
MPVGANELDLFDDPYHPHGECLSLYESLIVHITAAQIVGKKNSDLVSNKAFIAKIAIEIADEVASQLKQKKDLKTEGIGNI